MTNILDVKPISNNEFEVNVQRDGEQRTLKVKRETHFTNNEEMPYLVSDDSLFFELWNDPAIRQQMKDQLFETV
jgi:hypothetical protein